ncbi:MAG TPA: hypothetical protein VEH81_15275 [Ktedonobacteraceae bacterium]|nr:hypothetical protein [Ktedonobacteraceae bacterium]HXZ06194.1 hypothetical protein [Ktedonobacteraceae bacterium]
MHKSLNLENRFYHFKRFGRVILGGGEESYALDTEILRFTQNDKCSVQRMASASEE